MNKCAKCEHGRLGLPSGCGVCGAEYKTEEVEDGAYCEDYIPLVPDNIDRAQIEAFGKVGR